MIHGILIIGVMVTLTLGATAIITTSGLVQSANALKACGGGNSDHSSSSDLKKAPLPSLVTMFT